MKTSAVLTTTAMIATLSASGNAAEYQKDTFKSVAELLIDTSIDVRIRNYR